MLECRQRALEVLQPVFDGNHPDLAAGLYHMGAAFFYMKKYEVALQYYSRALAMW